MFFLILFQLLRYFGLERRRKRQNPPLDRAALNPCFLRYHTTLLPGYALPVMDTRSPVNVCTNSVFFDFGKSELVNVGNAKSMFDELVVQCGGATGAIVGVSCTSAILNVTFRDNFAASALVKRFQEKRTRHELSSNYKNCRVYFSLPADLQARRQELFKDVTRKNASSGGQKFYVDEFDLTEKKLRNELNTEFRNCRICFNLSKELQTKRNNLYKKVNEMNVCGVDNLYVDEYDLTV
uniref:RRM domain-containing protein n=1 Tax=Steinernema glaseri TaxID=37863 RepID=A0A1I7Y9E2_9BILA